MISTRRFEVYPTANKWWTSFGFALATQKCSPYLTKFPLFLLIFIYSYDVSILTIFILKILEKIL